MTVGLRRYPHQAIVGVIRPAGRWHDVLELELANRGQEAVFADIPRTQTYGFPDLPVAGAVGRLPREIGQQRGEGGMWCHYAPVGLLDGAGGDSRGATLSDCVRD